MEENNNGKKIDFTYPEGMKKAAALLTFLPEEQREALTMALASSILMF